MCPILYMDRNIRKGYFLVDQKTKKEAKDDDEIKDWIKPSFFLKKEKRMDKGGGIVFFGYDEKKDERAKLSV